MQEGTKHTLSSTNDYQEGIKSINSLDGYLEAIKENGVYAIHIEYLYCNNTIWDDLYKFAFEKINPTNNQFLEYGGVSAAILTKKNNIYTGVCIDTASSLGMCAERNAISNMLTNGEINIKKLICVNRRGEVILPCGACRELLMQLSNTSSQIEILINKEKNEIVTLKELMPNWWGQERR